MAWKLIDIPDILTDDWGSKLANGFLPEIFKRGNVNGVKLDVEDCKQGGMYAVCSYPVENPTGSLAGRISPYHAGTCPVQRGESL